MSAVPVRRIKYQKTPKRPGRLERGRHVDVFAFVSFEFLRLPFFLLKPWFPCSSMLLDAARCCSMLLDAARCCSMLLNAARCCSMLLDAARCCLMCLGAKTLMLDLKFLKHQLDAVRCCLILLDSARFCSMLLDSARCCAMLLDAARCCLMLFSSGFTCSNVNFLEMRVSFRGGGQRRK